MQKQIETFDFETRKILRDKLKLYLEQIES